MLLPGWIIIEMVWHKANTDSFDCRLGSGKVLRVKSDNRASRNNPNNVRDVKCLMKIIMPFISRLKSEPKLDDKTRGIKSSSIISFQILAAAPVHVLTAPPQLRPSTSVLTSI